MTRPLSAAAELSAMLGNGTGLPPRPVKKKQAWLPRESKRRKAERPLRVEAKLDAELRDQGCVAGNSGLLAHVDCGGRLEANELVRRGQWQGGYLVLGNIVTLCRNHHTYVTLHPDEAHATGLQLKSWERPT